MTNTDATTPIWINTTTTTANTSWPTNVTFTTSYNVTSQFWGGWGFWDGMPEAYDPDKHELLDVDDQL